MSENTVNVQPWTEAQPPTDAAIRRIPEGEELCYYRWSNGPGDVYGTLMFGGT